MQSVLSVVEKPALRPSLWADSEFQALPDAERARVMKLDALMRRIAGAPVLQEAYKAVARSLNERGMAPSSVEKKYLKWRAGGGDWRVLVNRARCPLALSDDDAIMRNTEFVSFVQGLMEDNQRVSAPAIRRVHELWRKGVRIPGYGTAREWWAVNFPGKPFPPEVPLPPGWGARNLHRIKPSKRALELARHGFLAAALAGPTVRRSTVDLRPLELLVCDDFRLDFKVILDHQLETPDGRRLKIGVYYLAGLALMDVASRRVIGWILKLQAKDEHGKRLVIKREDTAEMFAQAVREFGLPREYAITQLTENATAALTSEAEGVLAARFGDRVRVVRTGVIDSKIAKNGWREGGGKPQHKGWIESLFNSVHNECAHLPGQIGSRYDNGPKHLAGEIDYTERTLELAQKVSDRAPRQVKSRLLRYEEAVEAFAEIIEKINRRTEHKIEGLATVLEWRRDVHDTWHAEAELAKLSDEEQFAVEWNKRKESPAERFAKLYRRENFEPVPESALAPLLSEPRRETVSGGQISWTEKDVIHYFYGDEREHEALLRDGAKYVVHNSRHEPDVAYLYDANTGAFAGTLPRANAVGALDRKALSDAGAVTQRINNRLLSDHRARHAGADAEIGRIREYNDRLTAPALRIQKTDTGEMPPVKPPVPTRRRIAQFDGSALV